MIDLASKTDVEISRSLREALDRALTICGHVFSDDPIWSAHGCPDFRFESEVLNEARKRFGSTAPASTTYASDVFGDLPPEHKRLLSKLDEDTTGHEVGVALDCLVNAAVQIAISAGREDHLVKMLLHTIEINRKAKSS